MNFPTTARGLSRQEPLELFQISDIVTQLSPSMNTCLSSGISNSDCQVKSIHTLGPRFTSSHLAAIELMRRADCELAVELHETFDDILRLRPSGDVSSVLALVPSAYAGANNFFMSERTELIGCVCIDTPPYHLAWQRGRRNPFLDEASEVSIATHPAPINLIRRLLGEDIRYRTVCYNSTVLSAIAANRGETDAALCNLDTINTYGMACSPDGISINMTWNLFVVVLA